mgnify:CR=1 FL=1
MRIRLGLVLRHDLVRQPRGRRGWGDLHPLQPRGLDALREEWARHAHEDGEDDEGYEDYWFFGDGRYDISARSHVFGGARYTFDHENRASPDDVAGAVVTQGTDTMEESVYVADLMLRPDREAVNGALFKLGKRVMKPDKAMSDEAAGRRLWAELARMTAIASD